MLCSSTQICSPSLSLKLKLISSSASSCGGAAMVRR